MVRKGLKGELHPSNCGFNHHSVDSFVKSQWQSQSKSIVFLLYRWLVALATIVIVVISMNSHLQKFSLGLYFIYLTRWGILLNMIVGIYGAILVSAWHFSGNVFEKDRMPMTFKIYWALHNIALVMALTITVFYWTLLYPNEMNLNIVGILSHAVNSVIMFVDVLIVAFPLRLCHVVQPIAFGVCYTVFSYIYHLCGGLDKSGNPYIYPSLNWEHPKKVLVMFVGVQLLITFIHVTLFWIHKLRVCIQRRISHARCKLPLTIQCNIKLN